MKFCLKDDVLDWRLVFLIILLFFFHILAIKLQSIGTLLFILENIILIYIVIKQRLDWFLYTLSIILPATFDIPSFFSNSLSFIPSVVSLPIVHGYLYLFLLLLFVPKICSITSWKILLRITSFRYLFYFAISTLVLGLIIGIITMLYEDITLSFRINMLLKQISGVGMFSIYVMLYLFEYTFNIKFRNNLKIIIFSALTAIIISSFVGIMLGFRGSYGDDEIILAPLSLFFSTTVPVFFFYKEYSKHKILISVLSILALFMQFCYSNAVGGKSWLVIIVLLFFLV